MIQPSLRIRRRPAFGLALLLCLAAPSFAAETGAAALPGSSTPRAATPSAPPALPRSHSFSNMVPLLARDPADPRVAVWDSLESYERLQRWAVSDSVSTLLVAELEKAPAADSLELSRALFYLANSSIKRRLYAGGRGIAILERALGIRERHAPPGDPLTIWAHVMAATFLPEAGDPERAIRHGEMGLRLLGASTPVDSISLAQVKLALAIALVQVGRADEAKSAYEDAIAIRQGLNGPEARSMVPMYAEYGLFLSRLGDFDAAREYLKRALRIAEQGPQGDNDYVEGCLSRLSTVENRAGNVAESLDLAQRVYQLVRKRTGENSTQTLRSRIVVAYRLQDLGDPRAAAALLADIAPRMDEAVGPANSQAMQTRLTLADCSLAIGDTATARRELARVFPHLGPQWKLANSTVTYYLQLVADVVHASGNEVAARESLNVAIRHQRSRQDPLGEGLTSLYARAFETFHTSADRAGVERFGKDLDALQDSTHVKATPDWPFALRGRAAAEARVGLRDAAWRHALEADRVARERLGYELRSLPDLRGLQLAQQLGGASDVLVALAGERPDDVGEAWDRIVRWRGAVRAEIARRRPPAAVSGDTAIVAAHARWIAAQRHLGQLVVSGAAHPDDPESAQRFEAARRDAEEAERAYVRAGSGSVGTEDTPSLARLLESLRPDQALVAFASGSFARETRTFGAFVATGADRRPRWVPLGAERDVDADVGAWLRGVRTMPAAGDAAAERACRALGRRVRDRVWDPVARATAGAKEILLVPEGPVAELPWLALPGAGREYLAESPVVIRVLNAERDLGPTPAPAGRGLLAVGGPDFDRAIGAGEGIASLETPGSGDGATLVRARSWPCAGRDALSLPALPATRQEVEDIARRWSPADEPPRVLEGPEAEEAAVKARAQGRAVIHIATHGVMVEDTCGTAAAGMRGIGGIEPVTSRTRKVASRRPAPAPPAPRAAAPWLGRQVWLALAGANRPPAEGVDENEGLLTAEEIVTLDLRGTDWVVLSACHSGLADAWAREGVLGMRRAFHLAGAKAVIASQWPVGDESTREWMAALYDARARGDAAGAAVTEACRSVLAARRKDGRSTHPFHWAAFAATGD